MKLSSRRLQHWVAGIFISSMLAVAVVVVIVAGNRSAHHNAAATHEVSPPAIHQHSSKKYHVSKKSSETALQKRVARFFEAYYLLRPSDTTATLRARLMTVAPSSFVQNLDPVVDRISDASQARIKQRHVIRCLGLEGPFTAPPVNGRRSLLDVRASVHLETVGPGGEVIASYVQATDSRWAEISGRWVIQKLLAS